MYHHKKISVPELTLSLINTLTLGGKILKDNFKIKN